MIVARRSSRIACALSGILSAGVSPLTGGGPLVVTGDGTPAAWDTSTPVLYRTDVGGLGTLSETDAVTLTATLFGRWHQVPTAAISFARDGSLPVDVDETNFGPYLGPFGGSNSPLGVNVIVFDADGAIFETLYGIGTGVLGFASPTFFSDGTTTIPLGSPIPAGATIVEGLAFLNGKWIDGVTDPGVGNFEMPLPRFEAVILHELGHFAGLDHTQIHGLANAAGTDLPGTTTPYETMLPFNFDQSQATLERDDQVSLSSLYPAPGFGPSTGRIEGRVLARDGRPLAGINVIARNVVDDSDAISSVTSAASSSEGHYTLAGLMPGATYRVEIQEIDVFHTGGSRVGPFSVPATLEGPPEFFNGPSESADPAIDNPVDATPITAQANTIVSQVDIRLNAQPYGVTNVVTGESRGPGAFTVADFNQDGILDFVTTQLGFVPGNLIRFYRGLGRGRFSPAVTVAEFPGDEDIVSGQFNTGVDLFLDIAVASRTLNEVRVYLGNGTGGFSLPVTVLNAPDTDTLVDLLTGDLNSDGRADLLAIVKHASDGSATVHALMGSPSGSFVATLTQLAASAALPQGNLLIGQFTGSPALDILGVSSVGPGVSGSPAALGVLVGSGSGTFSSASISLSAITERLDPFGIASGDFNEDGRLDLVLSDLSPVGGPPNYTRSFIDILLRAGSGFSLSARYDVPETFQPAIAVADLNGDGHRDIASTGAYLAAGRPGAKVNLGLGAGNGSILSRSTIWGLAEFPQVIATADLDGNGAVDLLISDSATSPLGLGPKASYSVLLHLPACASPGDCDDGVFCNGQELCDLPRGECVPGPAPSCDDANPCTADSCGQQLVLLNESFENVVSAWVSSSLGGADTWHQDRYTCFSDPFPSTMLSSNGNAGGGCIASSSRELSQLLGPAISLPVSGTASLSFDALSFDEAGSCLASGERDAHDVGITMNGGATYTVLNDCNPLTGGIGVMSHHQFDLTDFAGQTIQVLFVYDTRDAITGHTFAVDNVLITSTPSGCGHISTQLDEDGDSHAAALCGGDDCDDTAPLVWSIPVEVTNLIVSQPVPSELSWDDQGFLTGPSIAYDLATGLLLQTPRLDYASGLCLQSTQGTSHTDARVDPPPGNGYWYMVRGRNACGSGSYGSAAADSELTACP